VAKRLKNDYDHLVLVCGHYEGIDERFIEQCVDEEISLGDFVLTGGEIAAMAVADSVCRLIPGVLADEQCYTGESHWDGLLEYPQYTRPEVWEGRKVPEVLINGDHSKVEHWRRKKQLERTKTKRPDMYAKLELSSDEDRQLVKEIEKEASRKKLTEPLICRKATPEDLPAILEIVAYARYTLKRHRVDQWQGEYPSQALLTGDIQRGELQVICHGQDIAAFFLLTDTPEPSYDEITDGKWTADLPYCILHRSAVAKDYRGTAVAGQLLSFAEDMSRAMGAKALRVDTHKKNKAMQNLLRDNGYRYRGNVLADEPGHDPARQAFEKILK
jgi:GNAT superfamily N-acetyltransferase